MKSLLIAIVSVFAVSSVSSAAIMSGAEGDGTRSIFYDAATGEVGVLPDGLGTNVIQILSASGIFTGSADAAFPAGGALSSDKDGEIAWTTFGAGIGSDYSFGLVAQPGLEESFLLQDLSVTFSAAVGQPLVQGDLVYRGGSTGIPEPASLALLSLAGVLGFRRRR